MSIGLELPRSGVHEVFCAVEKAIADGRRVVPLHIAEPTPRPAPSVIEALTRAMKEPFVYTSVHGLPEFNKALLDKLAAANGIVAGPEHVVVCAGASQGMLSLERMLAEPGAEIMLPAIHWPLHLQQALLAGFVPRFYPLEHDFSVDPDRLEAAITANTKVLFINTPHNPTGAVYPRALLERMLDIARAHDLWVISDEAYEDFVYEGEHLSLAALEADVAPARRRVFSVFTFSKSYGLGTSRLGYIAAPNDAMAKAFTTVQEASIMAPSTLVQHAGRAALADPAGLADVRAAIAGNRDTILRELIDAGLLRALPRGGWYALLDLGDVDATRFALTLVEREGVAVVPAAGFALRPQLDGEGHITSASPDPAVRSLVRIAYSGEGAELAEGLAAVRRLLAEGI